MVARYRIHTEVFVTELEQALRVLALLPGAGTSYPQAGIAGLRRIYVRKVACHLCYTFDEHDVIVRAIGCSPQRGPRLNR